MSSQQAFDSLAPTYDDTFSYTRIGRYLRDQVHARLATHFSAGDHVLEMGCGTGEDALWLAARGINVTATDASPAMLDVTRAKKAENPLVQVQQLDLRKLPPVFSPSPLQWGGQGEGYFSGAFSNFGALNCLSDWKPLSTWLAPRIKPGGIVGLGVMSPLCIWEPLWHGLHLDFKTATRRWRHTTFQPDDHAEAISIHYPSVRHITADFAPHFRRVHLQPLGLFLPPSDVFGVIESRPRLLNLLMSLESRFGSSSKLALFADHYWIEFRRE